MSMKSAVRGVFALPTTLRNALVLKCRHVQKGKHLKIAGRIYIVSNGKESIVIGDDVKINSCYKANPIGGDTRTILFCGKNGKISIGDGCGISNATLCAYDTITIGKQVLLGGGTKIYTTDFHWLDYEKRIKQEGGHCAPVTIGDGAFIGAHSIILKGVTVGRHSIVGAGSVVTKDIPNGEIWAGNPAKFIRKIEETDE